MRTDFKEERKWKIANAYLLSRAVMAWHETPDKSTVCVKVRKPTFLTDEFMQKEQPEEPVIETKDEPMEITPTEPITTTTTTEEGGAEQEDDTKMIKSDVEMTEPLSIDTSAIDSNSKQLLGDEDEEEEPQNSISAQVIGEYRTLIQVLSTDQTVLTLLEDHDDIISLFPELLLYTAPDADSIGNDPYFDEAEYGRIVPFKLSTQRILLEKPSKKRNSDGQVITDDNLKVLPRNERYDNTAQLSRKSIMHLYMIYSVF